MKNTRILLTGVVALALMLAACSGAEKETSSGNAADVSEYVSDGEDYLEDGELDKAAESFRKAMTENPKSTDARRSSFRLKDPVKA